MGKRLIEDGVYDNFKLRFSHKIKFSVPLIGKLHCEVAVFATLNFWFSHNF
ncbi:hypothetical protein [Treponema bryantii]|uniref:hypothetical protein n=1 Tax=Treponema bryantii TaxID=163 RepID=UPI0015A515BC|nr:hypothetical protein [Treponema bryantii]